MGEMKRHKIVIFALFFMFYTKKQLMNFDI